MEINQGKSKIMHFRNPSTPRTERIYACGESILEIVDSYMYLGLLLTQHLGYSLMAKQVSSSASRALGLLISKCKSAGGLPFSTFTKLYDSTVGSIIAYSSLGMQEISVYNSCSKQSTTVLPRSRKIYPKCGRER